METLPILYDLVKSGVGNIHRMKSRFIAYERECLSHSKNQLFNY